MAKDNLDWLPEDFVCSPKWFLKALDGLCELLGPGRKVIDGRLMLLFANRCKEHVMSLVMENVPKIDFDSICHDETVFDDLFTDLMEERK